MMLGQLAPHRRVAPDMWSFLGDQGLRSPGLAHEITACLADGSLVDQGQNVITHELAAGITPEEFRHGPVSYNTSSRKAHHGK